MPADIQKYLDLVASQHKGQPDYTAFMSVFLQGQADARDLARALPGYFDLDTAVGKQLDVCGEWIGRSRIVKTAISGVYFSWDTVGLGWGQGVWYQKGDDISDVLSLPDYNYRILLQFGARANRWDGTLPGAYDVWDPVFAPLDFHIEITDNQDMTIDLAMVGTKPDALTLALFTNGYFDLKPAGVAISSRSTPP